MFSKNKKINHLSTYILFSLISFALIILPHFDLEGNLTDPDSDILYFTNQTLSSFIYTIKNEIGVNRILAFSMNTMLSHLFELIPFKAYLVVLIFYSIYFIICEKILSLLGVTRDHRLLIFFFSTSSILIIPTVFLWMRTMMELFSVLLAWFFINLIVKSNSERKKSFLIILWGILSFMVYELHYPFFVVILISFGLVSTKIIKWGILFTTFLYLTNFFQNPKINIGLDVFFIKLKNLLPYVSLKMTQLSNSLRFESLESILIPVFFFIVFSLFCLKYFNDSAKKRLQFVFSGKLHIFFTIVILLVFFMLSSPSTLESIKSEGKISWNVLNIFWFNIILYLMLGKKSNFVRSLNFFTLVFITALSSSLNQIFRYHLDLDNTDFFSNSVFKNVVAYVN